MNTTLLLRVVERRDSAATVFSWKSPPLLKIVIFYSIENSVSFIFLARTIKKKKTIFCFSNCRIYYIIYTREKRKFGNWKFWCESRFPQRDSANLYRSSGKFLVNQKFCVFPSAATPRRELNVFCTFANFVHDSVAVSHSVEKLPTTSQFRKIHKIISGQVESRFPRSQIKVKKWKIRRCNISYKLGPICWFKCVFNYLCKTGSE